MREKRLFCCWRLQQQQQQKQSKKREFRGKTHKNISPRNFFFLQQPKKKIFKTKFQFCCKVNILREIVFIFFFLIQKNENEERERDLVYSYKVLAK